MLRSTKSILATLGLTALATLGPLGCSTDGDDDEGGGSCDLLAGDLVITEIVANVAGDDQGLEWFEIYNAGAGPIELEGRTLIYSKIDGTGVKRHTIARSLEVPAGGYVVVGAVLDEVSGGLAHLDYGYGEDLGEFGNAGGYLAIGCDGSDEVIDEVYYVDVLDTASRAFDGSQVPDAVANDTTESWCDSKTEFMPGFAATPGAANDVCGSQATCESGGETIEVARPSYGELVITEVMANPEAVGDDFGEWFEIHSKASAVVHLNGLKIGKDPEDEAEETIADSSCIALEPGAYALVAKDADAMVNGELPATAVVWETGVSLTNTDGSLWIGIGDELLDLVTWGSVGAGEAWQLDPDFGDPAANDELGNWCDATEPYGPGDLGTPGAENSQCMIPPPEGQCYEDGQLRDVAAVELGDLVITEFLSNPDAVEDADGEWFEVLVKGAGDLNGLEIAKAGEVQDTIATEDCIAVTAGQHVVFARSADAAVNGGLPQVDLVFDMALNNTNSDLSIGYGGEVWDAITWSSTSAGRSRSLGAGNFTAAANDDEQVWCDGAGIYGDGDQGTPGWDNPECDGGPVTGQCVDPDTDMMRMVDPPAAGELVITEVMPNPDAVPDADGEWFELHASGTFDLNGLQIGKAGAFDITVGASECIEVSADSWLLLARSAAANGGLPQPTYVYDSGFSLNNSGGSLQIGYDDVVFDETSWASSPTGAALSLDLMSMMWCPAVDPYGDGDLGTPGGPNPACGGGGMDGQCFDGQDWRDVVVPSPGDLVITEFMANPDAVSDTAGEWFEIRALASFDLNGLELGKAFVDGVLETVDVGDCIALSPGDTALLGRNGDALANGGLPALDYEFGFSLNNSNSALHVAADGVLLDEITWTSVATGSSTSLDPDSYDPGVNDIAVNGAIWCYSSTPYGDGDNGTPDADNEQCD